VMKLLNSAMELLNSTTELLNSVIKHSYGR
jgi:hypothetical protein